MDIDNANTYFGWDLLFRTLESDLKNDADIIIAVVHWILTRHSFQCLGIGDDKTLTDADSATELLPNGWNRGDKTYQIRYICNNELFILHGIVSEGTILINLLHSKNCKVSNIGLNIDDTITCRKGKLQKMIPRINEIIQRLKNELITPVYPGNKTDGQTQTHEIESPRTCFVDPHSSRNPILNQPRSDNIIRPIDPLRDVGRGDLDPLGGGAGGGMIFRPPPLDPGVAGFPGGPRPPGPARFDPFQPPEPGRVQRPDPTNDHFPPPGYDDMFN